MISNQILQNTIDGLKGITRIDLCIIDVEGKVLAATFPDIWNRRLHLWNLLQTARL
jgi:hypothetical protein